MPEPDSEKRYFTLEEANACVPQLQQWLGEMQRIRRRTEDLQDQLAPVLANVHLNTGGPAASEFAVAVHRVQQFSRRIREEGIFLRDVESGLCDFPAIHLEHEVFWCWKLGEDTVQHWHEVDGGFAGRKALDEDGLDDPNSGHGEN